MFRKNYIVKINLPGGIVATGDLYPIVEAADRYREEFLRVLYSTDIARIIGMLEKL